MATSMQQRRGTAADWTLANEVLPDGAVGIEEDTGKFKIGDDTSGWNDLPYAAIPMQIFDTIGDLIVGAGDNAVVKLARGSTDQVLTVKSDGTLYWSTSPASVPKATVTAAGDLIIRTGAGTVGRLGKGANGQQLAVVAGALAWVTSPDVPLTTVTTAEDLIVGSGAATVKRLAKGTNGQVLTVSAGGILSWATPAATIPLATVTTAGDLIVGSGSAAVARLAVGANGKVLGVSGGVPAWITVTGWVVCTSSTRPAHAPGLAIYETDTTATYISNGATWLTIPNTAAPQNFLTGLAANTNRKIQTGVFTIAYSGGSVGPITITFVSAFTNTPVVMATSDYVLGSLSASVVNTRPSTGSFAYFAKAPTAYTGNTPSGYIATDA